MTGSTHAAVAVAATLFTADQFGFKPDSAGWLALLIGSLAPDLDARNASISRPGRLFGRFLPRALQWPLDLVGELLSRLTRAVFGHRKALHWPISALALIAAGTLSGINWLSWFGWGYLLHILADACTKGGIQLFAPFWLRNIRWSPIRTKSWAEKLLFLLLIVYIVAATEARLPEELRERLHKPQL